MTMTKQDKWVFAKEMVDKGHTQTAVAEMLNVSKTTITSYLFKAKYELEARERAKNPKTIGDLYLPRRVRNALYNHSVYVGPDNWLKMTFDEFFSKSYSPQWMADNIRDLGKAGVVHLITQLNKAAPKKADAWCKKNKSYLVVGAPNGLKTFRQASNARVRQLERELVNLEQRFEMLQAAAHERMELKIAAATNRVELEVRKNLAIALGERTGWNVHWTQVMQDKDYVYFHDWEYPDAVTLFQKPLAVSAEPWDERAYVGSVFYPIPEEEQEDG